MSARKGLLGIKPRCGNERIVDFHSGYDARLIGAGARDDALQEIVANERGKSGDDQAFPKLLIHQPIDEADKQHREERFAKQRECRGEESPYGTA